VDGDWKDEVIFIPIVVWREAAERCGERLKKGSPVSIEGRISQRRWETKEGQKRSALEVVARKVQFLSRPVVEGGEESSPEEKVSSPEAPEEVSSPESEEEEIPF
jgi:single-strand DNA-binding protein